MTFETEARQRAKASLDALANQLSQVARKEFDALRASLDARIARLDDALPHADSAEALEDLVREVSKAATQQAEEAASRARLEAQEVAQTELAAMRADAKSQLDAAQAANRTLNETIEGIRQQLRATEATSQIEINTSRVEFQTRLDQEKTVNAELAGRWADAQREAAAARNEVETLTAHLDEVRGRVKTLEDEGARTLRALDEATAHLDREVRSRVSLEEALEAARREATTARAEADTRRFELEAAVERIRTLEQARLTPEAAVPQTESAEVPRTDLMPLDRVRSALDALSAPTSARTVLEAVVEQLGHEFAQAALFVAEQTGLKGWRSHGLNSTIDIKKIAVPLTIVSPLTQAFADQTAVTVDASRTGATVGLFGSPIGSAIALPILANGRVIAVAYAEDASKQATDSVDASWRIAKILVDHVNRRLAGWQPALPQAAARPGAEANHAQHSPTRHARRVKIQEGTEVLVDGSASVLVDLSPLGAQVLSPNVMRPNRSMHLSLPFEEGALPCRARVVWAAFEQSRGGGPVWYRAGVKFTHVDTAAVETFAIEHAVADDVKVAAAE